MKFDLSISVVQSYIFDVRAGLASLHYVTFIEPLIVLPTEPMSYTCVLFRNTSNKEVLQTKLHDTFLLLENHYFLSLSYT
jgi:hypothetical protein